VIPEAVSADGHALTEQYEAMRHGALAKDGYRDVAHGLALLMRKGMAAWMRGIAEHPSPVAAVPPTASAGRLPEGIERGLIDIVAAMALATATATTTATGGMT
jgi:hypothetical protein